MRRVVALLPIFLLTTFTKMEHNSNLKLLPPLHLRPRLRQLEVLQDSLTCPTCLLCLWTPLLAAREARLTRTRTMISTSTILQSGSRL